MSESSLITLKLKSPKEEKSIQIHETASIKELRDEAAKTYDTPVGRVCLIFAGKILKDEDTLAQHKLKDGLTVHIVIRTETQQQQRPATQGSTQLPTEPSQPSQNFGFGFLPSAASNILNDPNASGNSFSQMQQSMQQQVMRNPELLRTMVESPLVQSLMSNPEVMRSIMQANPQMRQLMERNPELNQMLNNPEILRQSMEIAANPAMMQEMMRSYDRAVLNLESIPGGGNHLQRIFQDIQEPMMDAMSSMGGGQDGSAQSANPFADLAGDASRQAAPTNEPMPNPWAASTDQTNVSSNLGQQPPATAASGASPSGPASSPFAFNPEMMSNAFQAPYVQSILETMSSNPETLELLMTNNPMFANSDVNTREQMRRMIPQLASQMNQPGFRNMLTNPRALQAMTQIQEGLRILQVEAPEVLSTLSMPAFSAEHRPTMGTMQPTQASDVTSATTAPAPADGRNQVEMATLLASMLNMMAPTSGNAVPSSHTAPSMPPEQTYAAQLEVLTSMGFVNRDANIRALIATSGDVNAAIDRLLQPGQGI